MPILIIALFYINDLMRIKRYYAQTEFVAQQMANIIQNISQNRSDKRIYLPDLKRAFALAWQTVYPGVTMFKQGSGYPFAHMPHFFIYYVTKDDNASTVSCRWMSRVCTYNKTAPPSNVETAKYTSNHSCSIVRYKTNSAPSNIYSSLKMGSEPRVIIEASTMVASNSSGEYNTSGNIIPVKQAFGLYFVKPKGYWGWYRFFPSVIIFTPKPGLFTNDYPTES